MEPLSYQDKNAAFISTTQRVLETCVDRESILELVDYDFLDPYSRSERIISKKFDLGVEGKLNIIPSNLSGSTHRLTLSEIPAENYGTIYVAGYPYLDTSRRDEAESAIYNAQSDEEHELLMSRLSEPKDNMPAWPMRPYVPSKGYDESLDSYRLRMEEGTRQYSKAMDEFSERRGAYIDRQNRKRSQEIEKDLDISNRYSRQIASLSIQDELRTTLEFFPSVRDNESVIAALDFYTDVTKASFFIPFRPIPFEDFKDGAVMQLFLSYLRHDTNHVDAWASYFNENSTKFPIQPRLAISSQLQTLGGKIE